MIIGLGIIKILGDLIIFTGKLNPIINLLIGLIQFIVKSFTTLNALLDARKDLRDGTRSRNQDSNNAQIHRSSLREVYP